MLSIGKFNKFNDPY